MGDTYGFSKVSRDKLLSGASRFTDDDDEFNYNDYKDVCGDLDREDFLSSLLKCTIKDFVCDGDAELQAYIRTKYDFRNEQALPVTRNQVADALKALQELDKKVYAMPFNKPNGSQMCAGVFDKTRFDIKSGYCEDVPQDNEFEKRWPHVFWGLSKKNVDILKEVYRIYGHRYYHYVFPWEYEGAGFYKGSENIQMSLKRVLKDMCGSDSRGYVYFLTWI